MDPEKKIDFDRAIDEASKIVLIGSALKTGLFCALIYESDIPALSRKLGATRRALYIVLEALSSLGYVNKKKDRYIIDEKARPLFVEHGEEYAGGYLPHFLNKMKAWLDLPLIIKGEIPGRETPQDVPAFMKAMASRSDKLVEEVVSYCLNRKKDAKTALDLGGGPGKYSMSFVKKEINTVLYDMPETIDYVSKEFGLTGIKNLTLMKGDFTKTGFEQEFKEGSFDIVFMGNISHIYSEEENKKIIETISTFLKKGGLIAIEDFVRGRSPLSEMFAVNMLASTESGDTYTESQYMNWFENAGFGSIEVLDLDGKEKQLITAILE